MMFRPLTTGVAALVEALTFIVGFALYATLLSNYTTGDPTAAESAAFLAEHETTFYLWNIVIFIVFGIVLVVLGLGLHEMLRGGAPALAQVATAFALIWAGLVIATGMIANIGISTVTALRETEPALAPGVWSTLDSVQNGLGGGNEVVGGVWVLLVCVAARRADVLPRPLAYLGLVIGAAGVVTVVPALTDVGALFGLGLIAWFAWLGAFLLRRHIAVLAAAPASVPPADRDAGMPSQVHRR